MLGYLRSRMGAGMFLSYFDPRRPGQYGTGGGIDTNHYLQERLAAYKAPGVSISRVVPQLPGTKPATWVSPCFK